jgi:hypothetical protein
LLHPLRPNSILKTPLILLTCIVIGLPPVYSQIDSSSQRKSSHYIGVQANQLIRQLVNFGGSGTNTINNPYLFVWSVNNKKTGWGMNTGLGLNLNEFTDGDANSKRTTNISDLNIRLGFEKKTNFGKRWVTSWGFDVVHQNSSNSTVTTSTPVPSNPNIKNVVDTESSTSGWGFGPRLTLNFSITPKLILGTEATYYYRSGSTSQKSTITNTTVVFDSQGRQIFNTTTNTTDNSSDFKSFQFNLPVALFLLFKF